VAQVVGTATAFSMYPNPAQTMVTLSNNEMMKQYSITDLNGRIVKAGGLNNVTEANVDVSELSSGIYLVNIIGEKGNITQKMMKQ
jgi:hypothetical protein